jgi:hypothetical protein
MGGNDKPTVSDTRKITDAINVLGHTLSQLLAEVKDLDFPRKSDPQIEESTGLALRKYTKLEAGDLILAEGMVEAMRQDNIGFQKQIEDLSNLNKKYTLQIGDLTLENNRLADMVRDAGLDPEVKSE